MKAAVCYQFGEPLVVEEVDLDPPETGEIKVRIAATAVCHSDIHLIRGELGGKVPVVAGHESAGYVEEIGEGVTMVKPGAAVVVSLIASCGRCRQCVAGLSHLCEARWPLSRQSRLHNKQGQDLIHMAKTASFAEYVIVDQSQVEALSSVVVVGTGGVGLNSVQGAALSGANPIIAVDISDSKLEAARAFGATHTVRADDDDAIQNVRQLTSGRGADYVFVTVGSTAAIQQGYSMSGPRGMTVVVGLAPRGETVTLPPLLPGERVFTGSTMGTTQLSVDVPKLVALYQVGRLKLDELITGRYPLEEINQAIESVEKGEALRNVIMF